MRRKTAGSKVLPPKVNAEAMAQRLPPLNDIEGLRTKRRAHSGTLDDWRAAETSLPWRISLRNWSIGCSSLRSGSSLGGYSSKWLVNPPRPVVVTLLGHHDLVDETTAEDQVQAARGLRRSRAVLQGLEQGHENPHGEDVVFHEQTQRVEPVDFPDRWDGSAVRPFAA